MFCGTTKMEFLEDEFENSKQKRTDQKSNSFVLKYYNINTT